VVVEFCCRSAELAFEICDPFRLLGELFVQPIVLLFQSFDLLCLTITCIARVRIASHSLLAL